MQERFPGSLTLEEYVSGKCWRGATLEQCPICGPECRPHVLGTYLRTVPIDSYIARFRCPRTGTTIGLLPDCLASRHPGTLDGIEQGAARAEEAENIEQAAEDARPGEDENAPDLPSAMRWVRRRVSIMAATLITVITLMPDAFVNCEPTVRAVRAHLGTQSALVSLREIAAEHLHEIARPLGLNPAPNGDRGGRRGKPQDMGPDPPPG